MAEEVKSVNSEITPEEISEEQKASANGSKNILAVMMEYAKKMNGYPYISASRIEQLPDPKKKEKASFLFDQMSVNFMAKNSHSGPQDFMDVFGNGKLVFIQAHKTCPTLADDGLYNAMDPNNKFIKTQLVGYFALNEDKYVETKDEKSHPLYDYFYIDGNEQYMGLQVNDDIPLAEYYKKHGTLYRRLKIPNFEPIIVVKQGPDKFGCIHGNPFPQMPTAVAALFLKRLKLKEIDRPQV